MNGVSSGTTTENGPNAMHASQWNIDSLVHALDSLIQEPNFIYPCVSLFIDVMYFSLCL